LGRAIPEVANASAPAIETTRHMRRVTTNEDIFDFGGCP